MSVNLCKVVIIIKLTRPASLAHAKIRMGWTSFHSAAAGCVSGKK